MQPVPGYDTITADKRQFQDVTDTQWNIIVGMMYTCALFFTCELALAIYNFWTFLIKQRKYKTIPLLMFYIVVILLASLRIYFSIWYFYGKVQADYISDLMKPILNINLGVVQCWILFELSLRINESIYFTELMATIAKGEGRYLSNIQGKNHEENIIKYGRGILFTFIPLEILVFAIWFAIYQSKSEDNIGGFDHDLNHEYFLKSFAWSFFALFILLLINVIWLINRL